MATKLRLVFSITILFLSFYGAAQQNYWKQKALQHGAEQRLLERFELKSGRSFSLDEGEFKRGLEIAGMAKGDTRIVHFPDENGELVPFQVLETQTLSPELAAKYPYIRSFKGFSLRNRKDIIRFSVSHKGVQSMVVHADGEGNTFMQPIADNTYIVYNRDANLVENTDFVCSTKDGVEKLKSAKLQPLVDGQVLRKFRLAVSATGEYTQYHGGTVADALAAINATVTRVNQIFETDLAVSLELVANTDEVIFADEAKDPYDGNLNTQVQNTLTDVIGEENYDIGHLFHEDEPGGNAGFVGSVCVDHRKGSAYSSSRDPGGDLFDIDFVAHEMGHQLGANHTWSFESEGTQVQTEPASGTTIMGYAGITGSNNVASQGDDYFHHSSIIQISDYLARIDCAEIVPIDNTPPVVAVTGNFVIPRSTAFVLEGSATDSDADDVLTYTWEQIDDGVVTQATFGPTNPSGANFRSQRPASEPARYFPKLSGVLLGNLTQTSPSVNSAWETVSDVGREMNFAFTVRDNALGGGQVASDVVNVLVVGGAGPFAVTSQNENEVYLGGEVQLITWDVAETHKEPVLAQTVDILLSTDSGLTFPIILAEDVPNDGSHKVIVPNSATTTARIMVKAHDNIFFAVNSANFSITSSEILLNFSNLEREICQPDDLTVPFIYETASGFNEEVSFSAISSVPELNISFSPPTASSGDTPVDMVVVNTGMVPEGNYSIEVVATSANVTKSVILDVGIYDGDFPEVELVSPSNGQGGVSTGTPLEWVNNPLYTSYGIEIASDVSFNNVIESATVFDTTYRPTQLENAATYYWRVKPMNGCGEGAFGGAFNFTTVQFSCLNKASDDEPLEISPIGRPTITSKIAFFEDLPLADIKVNLGVDHTFLSDLAISLTSPQGTTVVLVSSSCGDLENIDATFDDNAPSFVCDGDPAISGTVKPLGALSSFKGESILGEWTLEVSDNVQSDGGMLTSFSLDVCVEGTFRPDADKDGIYDDGDDLCLGTPLGQEVDATGCAVYRFPNDNFSIEVQSESCRNQNDGRIAISPVLPLSYTVSVSGNGTDLTETFTSGYAVENLQSGAYQVCISGTDGTLNYLEHCFELVIIEPDPLSVVSMVSEDGQQVVLNLQGSEYYNLEFNGQSLQTKAGQITLNLKNGKNSLKVYGDLSCKGVYEEDFIASDRPLVYPNPFWQSTQVFFGSVAKAMRIDIYGAQGQWIKGSDYRVNDTEMDLDLSDLPSGMYFVRFDGDRVKGTVKVIKR